MRPVSSADRAYVARTERPRSAWRRRRQGRQRTRPWPRTSRRWSQAWKAGGLEDQKHGAGQELEAAEAFERVRRRPEARFEQGWATSTRTSRENKGTRRRERALVVAREELAPRKPAHGPREGSGGPWFPRARGAGFSARAQSLQLVQPIAQLGGCLEKLAQRMEESSRSLCLAAHRSGDQLAAGFGAALALASSAT